MMAASWLVIGLVLAGELVFAVLVALITRLFSKHLEGQTYGLVVLGVAGVVTIAGPVIGWGTVGFLGACFAVAAIPMAVEYYGRVINEARKARAAGAEALNEHTGASGQE
jgi:MFS family permease